MAGCEAPKPPQNRVFFSQDFRPLGPTLQFRGLTLAYDGPRLRTNAIWALRGEGMAVPTQVAGFALLMVLTATAIPGRPTGRRLPEFQASSFWQCVWRGRKRRIFAWLNLHC